MICEPDEMDAERIADTLDRAAQEENFHVQECIKQTLRRIEKPPADFDGIHCVDCDEEIPQERLATGAFRDIICQSNHELRMKHRRRD